MDKTPMQYRIEMSVTGGIGYDSQTDFSETNSIYSEGLKSEDVKNTNEGLIAHLRELFLPEHKNHGVQIGHLFSYSGRRINITSINDFRYQQMLHRNQKFIDKAYVAEAKRRGRINTLANGVVKKIFGEDYERMFERINWMPPS